MIAAAVAFCTLAVHAFITANRALLAPHDCLLWNLTFLKLNEALTLFFAALSLLAIQHQLTLNNRPYVVVVAGAATDSQLGLTATPPLWRVAIKNVGPGVAIVRDVLFNVTGSDPQSLIAHNKLMEWMSGQSINNASFCVSRFSRGSAIGSDYELTVFEGHLPSLTAITELQMQLEFRSALGERFVRTMYLLEKGR